MKRKAIILGTGDSAKHFKQDKHPFDFVLGINDAVKLGYKMDAICFVDTWKRVVSTRPDILETPKLIHKFSNYGDCPLPYSLRIPTVNHVFNGKFNIDRKPVSSGSSSALYAICIACLYGFTDIEVFGVDLVTHQAMGASFMSRKLDIEEVPTFAKSGIKDMKKWAGHYSLHNAVLELRMLRAYLDTKKIKMKFTDFSPIARIINED
jgi:hypothetical protein